MAKKTLEFEIGIFVTIAFFVLLGLVLFFGNFSQYFKETYHIYAYFNYIGGVTEGAPVKWAGRTVGKVTEIGFDNKEYAVKMKLQIESDAQIKNDSVLKIVNQGMLAEPYLEFSISTSSAAVFQPGDEVKGKPPTVFEELLGTVSNTLDNMTPTLERLRKVVASIEEVVGDPDFKKNIKATAANVAAFTAEAKKAGSTVNEMIGENRKKIKTSMENMNTMTAELRTSAQELKKVLTQAGVDYREVLEKGKLKANMISAGNDLANTAKGASDLMKESSKLIQKIEKIADSQNKKITAVMTELETLARNANEAAGHIKSGEGNLGKVIYDDAIYREMNELITHLKEFAIMVKENPKYLVWGKPAKQRVSQRYRNTRRRPKNTRVKSAYEEKENERRKR